jgi:hypothetical protein
MQISDIVILSFFKYGINNYFRNIYIFVKADSLKRELAATYKLRVHLTFRWFILSNQRRN